MPQTPFDILNSSWPRPVLQLGGAWASDPEWDAPLMPYPPPLKWMEFGGGRCWTVDWREHFSTGLKFGGPHVGGEMKGFHVVFRLRVNGSGVLHFWDDDGSIIRRNHEMVHHDRHAHAPSHSELTVTAGDCLEIAQWQHFGDWIWGARLTPSDNLLEAATESLLRYLGPVSTRLRHPDGPPLKMYIRGDTPMRSVLSLYSMILNGYSPSAVHVFGDYQWTPQSRNLLETLLPFATFQATDGVLRRVEELGGAGLSALAQSHWPVMKTCIGLLCPPDEYCFMDDDIFVLDPVDEALEAFAQHNLVFAQDADFTEAYTQIWAAVYGRHVPLSTATLNTGLYWLRWRHHAAETAANMLRVAPEQVMAWMWEQSFMANLYADEAVCSLPTQRYFYPIFDGLPGGMVGYDYTGNPCGFVTIHFGGLPEKPSDEQALVLVPQILKRRRCRDSDDTDKASA